MLVRRGEGKGVSSEAAFAAALLSFCMGSPALLCSPLLLLVRMFRAPLLFFLTPSWRLMMGLAVVACCSALPLCHYCSSTSFFLFFFLLLSGESKAGKSVKPPMGTWGTGWYLLLIVNVFCYTQSNDSDFLDCHWITYEPSTHHFFLKLFSLNDIYLWPLWPVVLNCEGPNGHAMIWWEENWNRCNKIMVICRTLNFFLCNWNVLLVRNLGSVISWFQ